MTARSPVAYAALVTGMLLTQPALPALQTGSGRIDGRLVFAPGGEPVRRAAVVLSGAAIGEGHVMLTGSDGRFEFPGLPSGRYTLSATRAPHLPAYFGSQWPGHGPGLPIALADGQHVAELTMTMTRGAVISGRILDSHGRPQAQAIVSVLVPERADGPLTTVATTSSNDLGEYRAYALPAGRYFVAAQSGFGFNGASEPTEADFRWALAVADRRSRLGAIVGLPAPEAAPARRQTVGYAPTLYPGVPGLSGATAVQVDAGQERSGIDIQLQMVPATRLNGQVLDAMGHVPEAVRVAVVWPGYDLGLVEKNYIGTGPSNIGMTLEDGRFTRHALVPGRYRFLARASSQRRASERGGGGDPVLDLWGAADIEVNGELERDLLITLQPGMTVEGTARMPEPRGAATPGLRLVPMSDQPTIGVPPATVNEDGTFTFEGVAPGDYALALDEPTARRFAIAAATSSGADIADGLLTVRSGLDLNDLAVTLAVRRPSLTGRLVDGLGRPAPECVIVVLSSDRTAWRLASRRIAHARPATDGSYAVSGLPPGEYFVAAVTMLEPGALEDRRFLEMLAAQATRVTLNAETVSLDLKIAGPRR